MSYIKNAKVVRQNKLSLSGSSVVVSGSTTFFNSLSGTTAEFTTLTGSNIYFSASNSTHWSGSAPTTIQDALNRVAAMIYNGLTGSII